MAAEPAVEVHRLTAVIDLRLRAAVGVVTEHDAAAAGHLEPAVEPFWLGREDVLAAEQFPKVRLTAVRKQLVHSTVDGGDRVGVVLLNEGRIGIAAAVLDQGAIREPEQGRPLAHPLLEWDVFGQLVQVVALSSDSHPETDSGRISQCPKHRDLVVAEEHDRVGPVARVAQGADAKRPVVDQVAEEDRPPLGARVRLERLEEPLEIAVDVPDDQDGQVVYAHSRHRTMLILSLIHISEPTRLGMISYAVFCLKKKKKKET